MAELFYDKINDYGSVTISLASPDVIRSWSYGEVKKPETINYRTYRSEKDGLFCERIFGPEKDYECFCGKYKGIKYKGLVCDRCGVKVTTAKVRRKRMGHINLAAPVAHIWFFKAMPSRIGNLLAIKTNALERVVYFQDYIVTEVANPDLPIKEKDLLTEENYRQMKVRYGDEFKAGMGAEAVRELLRKIDLEETAIELRKDLKETGSKQKKKDLIKRLKTVEMIKDSPNKPDWMVLEVVPVIPPDLRPLVMLESGNFATSDLNDLYRRLINRNNRLKKLISLNAPEVIIRNEKRMLQQSVDALFDNNRCRRPVMGNGNRPLKSLTDMIKGKQGRFRENLLGKRVDYSARSVIVVEPTLHLNQCGLPKKIALELYQPFIIRRLKELGFADTIKSAKKMLERKDEEVWDILEDVIYKHPVMLNRAPTLHRMGIQAFEPILVEGNAIKIHPLVCGGFNADFDGDQMAVHLPLSLEAQVEVHTLMLSTNNIFSPAHGNPIIAPSQDIVLGCYYLTAEYNEPNYDPHKARRFGDLQEAIMAFQQGKITKHEKIWVRFEKDAEVLLGHDRPDLRILNPQGKPPADIVRKCYLTTVGRILFNDMLPKGMPFYNFTLKKKDLNAIIATCHKRLDKEATLKLLDDLKATGFRAATEAALSIAKGDIRVPRRKNEMILDAQKAVDRHNEAHAAGAITLDERSSLIIDEWTKTREELGKEMMVELQNDVRDAEGGVATYDTGGKHYLNPIYIMADSGARGSVEQIRQLAGMRGLMAKPSGKIIETPIKANFREGLRVLEYFSSTHGARKGLADTALKTADSGYLTRKLVDVAQNVVINEHDCKTRSGVTKRVMNKGEKTEISLYESIRGRVSAAQIKLPDGRVLVKRNQLISDAIAKEIDTSGIDAIEVRSALTCESPLGCCAMCYGADLSRGELVELGMAVGIIAAQSIGEPGTQLTMRTFHVGGIASTTEQKDSLKNNVQGTVRFEELDKAVENAEGKLVALNKRGEIVIVDDDGIELERHNVPLGAVIQVQAGKKIKGGTMLCRWDPFTIPIISETEGRVRYADLVEGKTFKTEKEKGKKRATRMVIEHKGDLHPEVIIEDSKGEVLAFYP
ncbi:MAG: DNA-directed RNA polymerase subunit beta', partial [Planctomycetota bacterium]